MIQSQSLAEENCHSIADDNYLDNLQLNNVDTPSDTSTQGVTIVSTKRKHFKEVTKKPVSGVDKILEHLLKKKSRSALDSVDLLMLDYGL